MLKAASRRQNVIMLSVGEDANTRDFLRWRPRQRVYNSYLNDIFRSQVNSAREVC